MKSRVPQEIFEGKEVFRVKKERFDQGWNWDVNGANEFLLSRYKYEGERTLNVWHTKNIDVQACPAIRKCNLEKLILIMVDTSDEAIIIERDDWPKAGNHIEILKKAKCFFCKVESGLVSELKRFCSKKSIDKNQLINELLEDFLEKQHYI